MKTKMTRFGWSSAVGCALGLLVLPMFAADTGLRPVVREPVAMSDTETQFSGKVGLREMEIVKGRMEAASEIAIEQKTTISERKAIVSRFDKVGLREWSTKR